QKPRVVTDDVVDVGSDPTFDELVKVVAHDPRHWFANDVDDPETFGKDLESPLDDAWKIGPLRVAGRGVAQNLVGACPLVEGRVLGLALRREHTVFAKEVGLLVVWQEDSGV